MIDFLDQIFLTILNQVRLVIMHFLNFNSFLTVKYNTHTKKVHKTCINVPLAGVAQWIEHQPMNQRVSGWFPPDHMVTCLGCRPGPQRGATTH